MSNHANDKPDGSKATLEPPKPLLAIDASRALASLAASLSRERLEELLNRARQGALPISGTTMMLAKTAPPASVKAQ